MVEVIYVLVFVYVWDFGYEFCCESLFYGGFYGVYERGSLF